MHHTLMRVPALALLFVASQLPAAAQECKLRFSLVYREGKDFQVGLTPEQKKFWDSKAKNYKGMCLDTQNPRYVIVWSESVVDQFDRAPAASSAALKNPVKPETNAMDWREWLIWLQSQSQSSGTDPRQTQVLRAKADFWIFDASKSPSPIVHKGEGSREAPQDPSRRPRGQEPNTPQSQKNNLNATVTISDPTVAMENALNWLKKQPRQE